MENREMKDSGVKWIGKIPINWKVIKINKVTNSYSGGTPSRNNNLFWDKGNIPWISSGEVNKEYIHDTNEKITELGLEKSSAKMFPKNTVIVALNGQGKTKGMSAITKIEASTNQSLVGFICDDDKLDYRYLNYLFKSSYEFNRNYYAGGNKRDGIAAGDLKQSYMPLPERVQQQKIAAFLDEKVAHIENIIEETKKSIENLKAFKQSLITETVTKGLNPDVEMKDSGIESIGEVPIAWNIEKVKFHSIIDPSYKENDRLPTKAQFVPMDQVKGGYLKLSEVGNTEDLVGKYTYFREGDIVIAKVRPSFENGNIAIATGLKNNLGFGTTEIFTLRVVSNKILTKFLFYYLRNSNFINAASSTMTGVGGLKRISSSFLMNYKIGIPSIEEQSQIVKYLDEKINNINSLLKQKEQLITELETYKKSLIYEYVTGKKEVK